jgi:hypothetical protein
MVLLYLSFCKCCSREEHEFTFTALGPEKNSFLNVKMLSSWCESWSYKFMESCSGKSLLAS